MATSSVGILIIVLPVLLLILLWLLIVLLIGVMALIALNSLKMLKLFQLAGNIIYLSNMVVSSVMVSDITDVYSESFNSCFDSKLDKTEEPTGL